MTRRDRSELVRFHGVKRVSLVQKRGRCGKRRDQVDLIALTENRSHDCGGKELPNVPLVT